MSTKAAKKTRVVEVTLHLTAEDAAALYALVGRLSVPAHGGQHLTRMAGENIYAALRPLFACLIPGKSTPISGEGVTDDTHIRELVARLEAP